MKNTKGFTLIELLVVISIIGVLTLMGLRLYLNQQDKAKNALVKANAGTIHTLIQASIADNDYDQATPAGRVTAALGDITNAGGCHNPYTGGTGNDGVIFESAGALTTGAVADLGKVAVASPAVNQFLVQGLDQDGNLLGTELLARK